MPFVVVLVASVSIAAFPDRLRAVRFMSLPVVDPALIELLDGAGMPVAPVLIELLDPVAGPLPAVPLVELVLGPLDVALLVGEPEAPPCDPELPAFVPVAPPLDPPALLLADPVCATAPPRTCHRCRIGP